MPNTSPDTSDATELAKMLQLPHGANNCSATTPADTQDRRVT
jgi:hypothetical protein